MTAPIEEERPTMNNERCEQCGSEANQWCGKGVGKGQITAGNLACFTRAKLSPQPPPQIPEPELCANCDKPYLNHFDGHRFCNDGDADIWKDPRWFPKHLADAILKSKPVSPEPQGGMATGDAAEPAAVPPTQNYWRCFHCDFDTWNRKEAAAHFGDRDDPDESKPLCKWWDRMSEDERVGQMQDLIQQLNDERDAKPLSPEMEQLVGRLRELATKATPGEWIHKENGCTNSVLLAVPGYYGEAIALCQQKTPKSYANAAHIAAASPENILKLLDALEGKS